MSRAMEYPCPGYIALPKKYLIARKRKPSDEICRSGET
jgi:hypothetical protein